MHRPPSRRRFLAACVLAPIARVAHTAPMPLLLRTVPSSGEQLPAVGLGTWQAFDVAGGTTQHAAAADALARFAELGGRVIDTSPMYGRAEQALGELMTAQPGSERLFLATKVWTHGRDAGRTQLARSRALLRRDVLDLVQVHNLLDADVHLATLRAERDAGRVRHVGLSHYHAGAHAELERRAQGDRPDVVQVNFSLHEPEAGTRLLDALAANRVAVLVNRPFAEGALFAHAGKAALPPVAAELGCSGLAQLALKWVISHPAVTCALVGTRKAHHVADNLGAASGPLPDAAQRARILAWYRSL